MALYWDWFWVLSTGALTALCVAHDGEGWVWRLLTAGIGFAFGKSVTDMLWARHWRARDRDQGPYQDYEV